MPTCPQCRRKFAGSRGKRPQVFCGHECAARYRKAERAIPLAERFWSKVRRAATDQCWLWQGARHPQGYGSFGLERGRVVHAHRVAWELTHGPIPDGLYVLHNCPTGDNPACCNPAHLWLGTQLDNIADMVTKGRQRGGRRPSEQCHFAKLTREEATAIRRLLAAGAKGRALARQFGVSEATISVIKSGQTWRE